jgi:hypothetical protein
MNITMTQSQVTPQSLADAPTPQVDLERKQQMKIAWKSYRGEFADPLKLDSDGLNDNVISNRCAPIVDKGVSFLFGQPIKIEATDETSTDSTVVQDYLDGFWGDDDDKMTLLSLSGINGGVCGEVFMKLIPAQGEMKYSRMVNMDPMLVRMVTPPDDCNTVLAYIIEYPGPNDTQCKQIIARVDPDGQAEVAGAYDLDDSWTITNYVKKSAVFGGISNKWQQDGEPEEWPYPFPPLFANQNLPNPNEPWGMPDLSSDLIRQNNVLNFIQSNTSRILKYYAHPTTWAKGVGDGNQIDRAPGGLVILKSMDAEMGNLEMSSDLSSSLSFAGTIRSDMDEQSRVPAVALGRQAELPRGNISGIALQLMFQPLIEKTTIKQRLYGRLIREISRAALVIAGLIPIEQYEDYKIDIHWPPLLPSDNLQAAQAAQVLQGLGVSQSTILASLGLDADDEMQKKQAEDARQLTAWSKGQGMPPPMPAQPQPGQPNPQPSDVMQPGQQQGVQP